MTPISAALATFVALAVLLLPIRVVSQRWAVALAAPLAVLVYLSWTLVRGAGLLAETSWASAAILAAALLAHWRLARRSRS